MTPEDAAAVSSAITDSGGHVLGLDINRTQPDGGYTETRSGPLAAALE